jgi:hypothetical protein
MRLFASSKSLNVDWHKVQAFSELIRYQMHLCNILGRRNKSEYLVMAAGLGSVLGLMIELDGGKKMVSIAC